VKNRLWITLVWSLWLAIALALGLPDLGRTAEPAVQAVELYFYINGDNDLISTDTRAGLPIHQGEKAFDELSRVAEAAGPGTAFHIYYDPNSAIGGNRITETTVRRYRDGVLVSEKAYGETDSGATSCFDLLLSEKYFEGAFRVLSFWSHGEGWEDIDSYDFSRPDASFSYLDLASRLEGKALDLVIFDACKMAYLETLSAYRGKADFVIASQFELPVDGTHFGNLAAHLSELRAKGLARAGFARELHARLNADTLEAQRAEGVFAPLALFDLAGFDSFEVHLGVLLRDLAGRFHGADWETLVGFSLDEQAVDLRALVARLKNKFGYDASSMIDAFGAIAPGKYGSILFYLPEEYGRIPDSSLKDELGIQSRKAWTEGLPNWDLVRAWLQ
jgi:hypothetical protein